MTYTLKDIQFSKMVEYNVNVKRGLVQVIDCEIDIEQVLGALKKNKFFRLVKSLTVTSENKGFFVTGKKVHEFTIKRLGNILTFSIKDGKSYHVEIQN